MSNSPERNTTNGGSLPSSFDSEEMALSKYARELESMIHDSLLKGISPRPLFDSSWFSAMVQSIELKFLPWIEHQK